MNDWKKNNGWILCSSKRFPGKFYYFNVATGECAWWHEVGNNLRSVQAMTDKSHCYPEPESPPNDDSPNPFTPDKKMFFNTLPRRVVHNAQAPQFGEATFQKYMHTTAPYMSQSHIIWTPIQLPQMMPQATMMPQESMMAPNPFMPATMMPQTPIAMPNTPDIRMRKHNDADRNVTVQTCNMPLSKRFTNYFKPLKDTGKRFPNASTPLKQNNTDNQLFGSFENLNISQTSKSVLKEPVFKRSRTQSESNGNTMKTISKSNSLESLLNSDNVALHKSTQLLSNKVDNRFKVTDDVNVSGDKIQMCKDSNNMTLKELDKNDLRFILAAKRRKSVDLGDCQVGHGVSGKKIKTSRGEAQPNPSKKKVTFLLGVEDESLGSGGEDVIIYEDTVGELQDQPEPKGLLYVMSDFDTLLADLQCVEEYVQADDKRRLVIPQSVRAAVLAQCCGASEGREQVLVARQLARKIVAPPGYYVIIPESEGNQEGSDKNYILNVCLNIINSGDNVIFITNNLELYDLAKTLKIPCFNTQQIKGGAGVTKPEVTFDLKKIHTSANKIIDKSRSNNENNLFLLAANEFKPYLVTNKDQNANSLNKNPFNAEVKTNTDLLFSSNTDSTRIIKNNTSIGEFKSIFDVDCENPVLQGIENLFINQRRKCANKIVNDKEKIPIQTTALRSDNIIPQFDSETQRKETICVNDKEKIRMPRPTEDAVRFENGIAQFELEMQRKETICVNDKEKIRMPRPTEETVRFENGIAQFELAMQRKETICVNDKEKIRMPRPTEETIRFENGNAQFELELQREETVCVNDKEQVSVKNSYEFKQKVNQSLDLKENSLNECLKMYYVDNQKVANLIKLRMDECVCVFSQIMENALVDILMRTSPITDQLTPPWVLYETTKKVQDLYGFHTELKMVAEKFRELLVRDNCKYGKLNSSMKPNDFMRILGCGNILIQTIKEIFPSHEELIEADISLKGLLQSATQPIEDEQPALPTPVLIRSDLDEDSPKDKRENFIKNPTEILEYLKKHYPQWRNVESPQDYGFNVKMYKPKIVRTFGRNLNLLNIDNTKTLTMKNPTENAPGNTLFENCQSTGNTNQKPTSTLDIICEKLPEPTNCSNFKSLFGNIKREPMVYIGKSNFDNLKITKKIVPETNENEVATFMNIDDLNVPKNSNTFNQETAGPKVIRPYGNLFQSKSRENILKDDFMKKHEIFQKNQTAEPNSIKNIEKVNQLQNKCSNNNNYDMDALDYNNIDNNLSPEIDKNADKNETISVDESVSFVYKIRDTKKVRNQNDFIIKSNNALNNDYDQYLKSQNALKDDINNPFTTDDFANFENNDFVIASAINNDSVSTIALNNDLGYKKRVEASSNDSNDKVLIINESTNDSGFENESLHRYSLVKTFLFELSEAFKTIYKFIDKAIIEFREEDVKEDKRRCLHHKANITQLLIVDIIDKLKIIIQRESGEGSILNELLLQAGLQASNDKRLTRYRQVIMKCLEQAQLLQNALRTMLILTDDGDDTVSTASADSGIRYCNIFE